MDTKQLKTIDLLKFDFKASGNTVYERWLDQWVISGTLDGRTLEQYKRDYMTRIHSDIETA